MDYDPTKQDPIDKFLDDFPAINGSLEFRNAIQKKTLAVLRQRRWVRRAGWMTGLAGCYGAGILTMWILKFSQPEMKDTSQAKLEVGQETGSAPAGQKPETRNLAPLPETARSLEWQAWDSEIRQPELFRLAGDKYLEGNDLEAATRCYRGALRDASDQELEVALNDTWLFMSLKEAKQEENRYAKLTGP